MAILHSCCCWRSVRQGSFACGIFTAIYYLINAVHSAFIFNAELKSLDNSTGPPQGSFLNPATTSKTSIAFTFLILCATSSGFFTSLLLLYGLKKDCKLLLLPWIINLVLFTFVDLAYICYSFVEHALTWNPSLSILITMDLFITVLHMYALLCVISQYQELKAGRGRAADDQNIRIPNIHYSSQPTATSFLSTTRRPMPTFDGRPTPTQSPTGPGPAVSFLTSEEISPGGSSRGPRKSVKFPDNSYLNPRNGSNQLLDPKWSIDVSKSPLISKKSDTAPLIETSSATEPVLQSNL